jgi:TRAP-type C4-dicarboxylate transport system substrate-binding protein
MALALVAASAMAQDKPVELKISHWFPPSHPLQKSLEEWAGAVERASGGSIRYKIFPAGQLGKAQEHYDLARDRKADVALVEPATQLSRFPLIAAGALPLLMANAKGGSAALDEWYRPYAGREMADVKFCFAFVGEPGTVHLRARKVAIPNDMRGLKIRPANAMTSAWTGMLGATITPATEPETQALLESSGADAAMASWSSVSFFGLDRATKFHLDLPLYASPLALVMSKASYEAMSVVQRRAIDASCNAEWAVRAAAPLSAADAAARAKLKTMPGHEVYAVTADQLSAWRTSVAPLQASWALNARKTGIDPDAALDGLKAALVKYKAGY